MVTSKDVAARAGTSQSTVSRVLRGVRAVDPIVAERVRAAAAELGYVPSDAARALIAGRASRIALVVERLTHPAFALVADLAHHELVRRGYRLTIIESDTPGGGLHESPQSYFGGVDGVMFCSGEREADLDGLLAAVGRPVVFVLRIAASTSGEAGHDSVLPDHDQAAELAVGHLWELGHRRIAMLGGTGRITAGFESRRAFLAAMARRGATGAAAEAVACELGYDAGFAAATELLRRGTGRPTALVTADDPGAYGAMDAARELGLRVPEDVSVVGFDDFDMSAWRAFDLTTVRIDHERIVRRAIELLTARIADAGRRGAPAVLERVPGWLVVRGSTTAVPGEGG